jgi:beta-lactamase superfamily II metal-dependent hydrolase
MVTSLRSDSNSSRPKETIRVSSNCFHTIRHDTRMSRWWITGVRLRVLVGTTTTHDGVIGAGSLSNDQIVRFDYGTRKILLVGDISIRSDPAVPRMAT